MHDRYHRQTILPQIGERGRERLGQSHALIIGCGALGSVVAENLARAGVGTLTIVDRDLVERTNLQRQTLFTEADAEAHTPKAVAAESRLTQINSSISIRAIADDFGPSLASSLAPGVDLLIDATDNFETRQLLNDAAVRSEHPLVYAGVVGTRGTLTTIVPGQGPCLRCLVAPDAAAAETCDTAGVLGAAVLVVAGMQAAQAIRLLVEGTDRHAAVLREIDAWGGSVRTIDLAAARDPDCPCCVHHRFEFLDGSRGAAVTSMCGRNSVQVLRDARTDLDTLAKHLRPHAPSLERTPLLVRAPLEAESVTLTVFTNGRTIVEGTEDEARARSLVARYLGG